MFLIPIVADDIASATAWSVEIFGDVKPLLFIWIGVALGCFLFGKIVSIVIEALVSKNRTKD